MYDCVFITHIPSFYKINLFNEISKTLNIFVVFLADKSNIREDDFLNSEKAFEHKTIRRCDLESHAKISDIVKTVKILNEIKYRMIIVSGWDHIEFWISAFLNNRGRVGLILESSSIESNAEGFKGAVKKLFLSRISMVFASGELHRHLLQDLGYKGRVQITKGVGLLNRGTRTVRLRKEKTPRRFLFVGRLSEEKNIDFIVRYFNLHPEKQLTLVGDGPLRNSLEEKSNKNIVYAGYKKNVELNNYYFDSDVFILPSVSETWGLVVEEALFHGLPVLVSKNCGCHGQVYKEGYEGLTFDPEDLTDFTDVENQLEKNYEFFLENVSKMDFLVKDELQVSAYIEGINEGISNT